MRRNYSGDQGDYTKYALLNQLARDGQLITGINWYLTEHHEAMTDAAPEPGEEKPPWRERKEAYVAHLAGCDDAGVHRVCLSDKLYNLRAINADFAEIGEQLWERFTAEPTEQLWYFGSLSDAFAAGRLAGTRAQQVFVAELNLMRRNVASGLPAQS
jgi:hypothetical protein